MGAACAVDPVPPDAPPAERLALLRGRVRLAVAAARDGSSRVLAEWWAACAREARRRTLATGALWRDAYVAAVCASMRGLYRADDGGDTHTSAECTLLHGDDCEGIAVAVVALLELGEVPAGLVWLLLPESADDHVTATVGDTRDRVMGAGEPLPGHLAWCEASIPAHAGEHPVTAAARLGAAYGRRLFGA